MIVWAPIYKQLGKYFANRRLQMGLTQAQAAQACGKISAQFVSNIERGVAPIPQYMLIQWLLLYQLDPEVFMNFVLDCFQQELKKTLFPI